MKISPSTFVDIIPSVSDIVSHALNLKPAVAAGCASGEATALCTTRIYTKVMLDDGTVADLAMKDNRYGVGYARVSSLAQRTAVAESQKESAENDLKDGWSEQDQLQRIVAYFVKKRQAFRIFSDCGLGGYLPWDDERLKEKMLRAKARRYQKMFEAVFLSDLTIGKYTVAQVEAMRAHLKQRKEQILTGGGGSEFEVDDIASAEVVEREEKPRRRRLRLTVMFRPALTELVRNMSHIHTLAVTDLSRLSRSQALSAEIGEHILEHKVAVVGLVENLDWMNSDEEIGNQLMALLIPKFAEYRLTEVLMNAMRGIVTMLEAGRPFGKIPKWLIRDKNGRAHILDAKAKAIRRMVELFLDDSILSTRQVALHLASEKFPPPVGTVWHRTTVISTLRSLALVGKQQFFGLEWRVHEALVDEATFARIQRKLERLQEIYPNFAPKEGRNVMAYLMKCTCGSNLVFNRMPSGVEQIRCNCSPAKRKGDPGFRHINLSAKDTLRFVDELMQEHPRVIMDAFRDSQERTSLIAEFRQAEAELGAVTEHHTQMEAEARAQARQNLKTLSIEESNPQFGATLNSMAAAFVAESTAVMQRLLERVKEAKYRLDTLIPQDVVTTLEQRVAAWVSLDAHAKNDLMLTFFKEWRAEGVPPHESFVPVLRNANEDRLSPIRLKASGKEAIRRRFPTAEEYFASVHEAIGL